MYTSQNYILGEMIYLSIPITVISDVDTDWKLGEQ